VAYNDRRGSAYTPAELSRVEPHESCRIKSPDAACFIFVCQTPAIVRGGFYLEEEIDVVKLILLIKDHEAIYDASSLTKYNGISQ
jgi:hypothetical protein